MYLSYMCLPLLIYLFIDSPLYICNYLSASPLHLYINPSSLPLSSESIGNTSTTCRPRTWCTARCPRAAPLPGSTTSSSSQGRRRTTLAQTSACTDSSGTTTPSEWIRKGERIGRRRRNQDAVSPPHNGSWTVCD